MRYSKGLVRYKDLKDHVKNMQKSKYERDMQARRNKDLTGMPRVIHGRVPDPFPRHRVRCALSPSSRGVASSWAGWARTAKQAWVDRPARRFSAALG